MYWDQYCFLSNKFVILKRKLMLASNFNTIQNHFLLEETRKLVQLEIINQNQFEELEKKTITTKTNSNILLRIGFFILGNFLLSSIFGLFCLAFSFIENTRMLGACAFIAGIITIVISEFLRNQKYFSYGLDDSFIVSITLFFGIATSIFSENINCIFITIILTTAFTTIRYVHTPSILIFLVSLVSYVGYWVIIQKNISSFILALLFFIAAVGIYCIQLKISQYINYYIYKNVFFTAKIVSILLAYLSLNYFSVRELSKILLEDDFSKLQEIPLASLFYITTFVIPIFYIFYGLKEKERTFLWIGLLTLGLSFATIRYYHDYLPMEYALLLAGGILFAIVYFFIQKIKNNTIGITFKEDKSINPKAFDLIKVILVNAQVNTTVDTIQKDPVEFGGGGFSGGGSGETF
ncbi:hypothetical protein C3B49_08410 [Flavobacterium columnare]|nr:hypothetical protein [Flavobacterium columnare]